MQQSSKSILSERRLQMQPEHHMIGLVILAAYVGVIVWGLHRMTGSWVGTGAGLVVLTLIGWLASVKSALRSKKLATARADESICQFARSFDRNSSDTVLIRSVYETVQEHLGSTPVPLRTDDRLLEDLDLDDDDLDEILIDAAELARRSLDSTASNPLYGRITTVRNLVEFLQHQPRL